MKIETNKENSFKPVSIAVIFLVIGLLAGILIGLNLPSIFSPPQQDVDDETSFLRVEGVLADDDPFLGSPDAPVTLIEFSDFECQFCKSFFDNTLDEIKTKYIDTGKVKYVLRDFPIIGIHPNAENAAEAANCANEQNKYWEFHDILFEKQEDWISGNTTAEFKKYSSLLDMDEEQFILCLESDKYREEISKDIQDGRKAGVEGTPTFFINGIKVVGIRDIDLYYKQLIDAEIDR